MLCSKYIYSLLGILIFIAGIAVWSYNQGKQSVQAKWDKETIEHLEQLNTLKQEYIEKENVYLAEINKIKEDYINVQKDYNNQLSSIKSDYSARLYESEQRYLSYKQKSTNSKGCSDIANLSGKLDRTLTEGILLVRELTETLKLRDSQLKQLGEAYKASMNLSE